MLGIALGSPLRPMKSAVAPVELLVAASSQMVFYDVDGQADTNGRRMFEYVSLPGAHNSTFAPGASLARRITADGEEPYVINSDGLGRPFPASPDSPGLEAMEAVASFRLVEKSVWSATFGRSRGHRSCSVGAPGSLSVCRGHRLRLLARLFSFPIPYPPRFPHCSPLMYPFLFPSGSLLVPPPPPPSPIHSRLRRLFRRRYVQLGLRRITQLLFLYARDSPADLPAARPRAHAAVAAARSR